MEPYTAYVSDLRHIADIIDCDVSKQNIYCWNDTSIIIYCAVIEVNVNPSVKNHAEGVLFIDKIISYNTYNIQIIIAIFKNQESIVWKKVVNWN